MLVISVIFDDDNDNCNGDDSMKHLTKVKSILIFICVYFDAAVQMFPLGGAVMLQK